MIEPIRVSQDDCKDGVCPIKPKKEPLNIYEREIIESRRSCIA